MNILRFPISLSLLLIGQLTFAQDVKVNQDTQIADSFNRTHHGDTKFCKETEARDSSSTGLMSSSTLLDTASRRPTASFANTKVIQTSDIRFKKNIAPLPYGLDEILELNTITYHWKNDSTNTLKVGLVAQNVQKNIPEVVYVSDDEMATLGINYSELVPVLINAIKELEAKNAALESNNKTLCRRITQNQKSLQNQIDLLMSTLITEN